MVLDHLAFHLMERGGMDLPMAWYIVGTAMRLAGRVAFPLYGFFLVQGFFHTGDWGKYMKRMVLLALVSEIPFNLICSGRPMYPVQNTLVTLSISLLALKGIRAVQTWEPEEGAFGGRAGAVWLKTAAIVLTAPLVSRRGMGGNAAVFFDFVSNGLTIHDVRQVPPIISLEVMLCHVQST